MKWCGILSIFLSSACSSFKYDNERQSYFAIKEFYDEGKPALASNQIFLFEDKYPNSEYLCELWDIQISFGKRAGYSSKYIKETEKKKKERCTNSQKK